MEHPYNLTLTSAYTHALTTVPQKVLRGHSERGEYAS
jgi:hypothetical protein